MRRRFWRGGRGPLRQMIMGGIPPLLLRSNELMAAGKYAEAADGLEQLAHAAEARGGRRGGRRAASLYLEAGRARLKSGQPAQALQLLQSGLSLLSASGLSLRLGQVAKRIIAEARALGFAQEGQLLSGFVEGLAPGFGTAAVAAGPMRRAPLPTHCPACGAPVRPDEVEWLDELTAECEYCGSPVRST